MLIRIDLERVFIIYLLSLYFFIKLAKIIELNEFNDISLRIIFL
jgi:hypothetical protein